MWTPMNPSSSRLASDAVWTVVVTMGSRRLGWAGGHGEQLSLLRLGEKAYVSTRG